MAQIDDIYALTIVSVRISSSDETLMHQRCGLKVDEKQ